MSDAIAADLPRVRLKLSYVTPARSPAIAIRDRSGMWPLPFTRRSSKHNSARRRRQRSVARATAATPPEPHQLFESLESRRLLAAFFPDGLPQGAIVVTNTNDAGQGSLRAAIEQANAQLGPDVIGFDIDTGAKTIALLSSLPAITDQLILDGTSQPGFNATTSNPIITIDGSSAGDTTGLSVIASSVAIAGVIVEDFQAAGIDIAATTPDITLQHIELTRIAGDALRIHDNTAGAVTADDIIISAAAGRSLVLENTTGVINFGTVLITARQNAGIAIDHAAGSILFGDTRVESIFFGQGDALDIDDSAANISFAALRIPSSPATGVNLANHTGSLTINAGSIASINTNPAIAIAGGAPDVSLINTTVSNTAGGSAWTVADVTGGSFTSTGVTTASNLSAGVATIDIDLAGANADLQFGTVIAFNAGANAAAIRLAHVGADTDITVATVSGNGAAALDLDDIASPITVGNMIASGNTTGLQAANVASLTVESGVITTAGAAAVDITDSAVDILLSSLTSTSATSDALSFTRTTGSFSVASLTNINTPAGRAIHLDDSNIDLAFGTAIITSAGVGAIHVVAGAANLSFNALSIQGDANTDAALRFENHAGHAQFNQLTLTDSGAEGLLLIDSTTSVQIDAGLINVNAGDEAIRILRGSPTLTIHNTPVEANSGAAALDVRDVTAGSVTATGASRFTASSLNADTPGLFIDAGDHAFTFAAPTVSVTDDGDASHGLALQALGLGSHIQIDLLSVTGVGGSGFYANYVAAPVHIDSSFINTPAGHAIHIENGTGPFIFDDARIISATLGTVRLHRGAPQVTITGDITNTTGPLLSAERLLAGNITIAPGVGDELVDVGAGVRLDHVAADITIQRAQFTNQTDPVIDIIESRGRFTFDDAQAQNVDALLRVTGAGPTFHWQGDITANAGLLVDIAHTTTGDIDIAGAIQSAGGVRIANATTALRIDGATFFGSAGDVITLDHTSGAVAFDNSVIGSAAGDAIAITAGAADVTFAGRIDRPAGNLLSVTSQAAGSVTLAAGPYIQSAGQGVLLDDSDTHVAIANLTIDSPDAGFTIRDHRGDVALTNFNITGGAGVKLINNTGSVTLNNGNVTAATGPALSITDHPGSVTITAGSYVAAAGPTLFASQFASIAGAGAELEADSHAAIQLFDGHVVLAIAAVDSTDSDTAGVELQHVTGSLTLGQVHIDNPAAAAFLVTGFAEMLPDPDGEDGGEAEGGDGDGDGNDESFPQAAQADSPIDAHIHIDQLQVDGRQDAALSLLDVAGSVTIDTLIVTNVSDVESPAVSAVNLAGALTVEDVNLRTTAADAIAIARSAGDVTIRNGFITAFAADAVSLADVQGAVTLGRALLPGEIDPVLELLGTGVHAADLDGSLTISNVFINLPATGIEIAGGTGVAVVRDITIQGSTLDSIAATNFAGLATIADVRIVGAGRDAIAVDAGEANIFLRRLTIDRARGHGLRLNHDAGQVDAALLIITAGDQSGVLVEGDGDVQISQAAIRHHEAAGVVITSDAAVLLRAVATSDNAGLGIDRNNDGPTPQGLADIQLALPIGAEGVVETDQPGALITLAFYISDQPDPSGFGEGAVYAGFIETTADDAGLAFFSAPFDESADVGQFVAATVTIQGRTSEFSPAVEIQQANLDPATVNVEVLESDFTEAGAAAVIRLHRVGSQLAPLTVNLDLAGRAVVQSDYAGITDPQVIPAGAAFIDLVLEAVDDNAFEGPEDIRLTVLPGQGYVVGTQAQIAVVLEDNEQKPFPLPDLAVGFGGFQLPEAILPGDTLTIDLRLRNLDDGAFSGFLRTELYLVQPGQLPTADDTPIAVLQDLVNLGPFDVIVERVQVHINDQTPIGSLQLIAVIDPQDVHQETNEINNVDATNASNVMLAFGQIGDRKINKLTIDNVTYKLKGDGFGVVQRNPGITPDSVTLYDTTDNSKLIVNAPSIFRLLDDVIVHGSAKQLRLNNFQLLGEIHVEGALQQLVVGDLLNAGGITIGGDPDEDPAVRIKAGVIQNLTMDIATGVQMLNATSWDETGGQRDYIHTPYLDKLKTKFDFEAQLLTTNPDIPTRNINVGEDLSGADIRIAGDLNKLVADRIIHSTIFAGIDNNTIALPENPEDFIRMSSIGSVTIRTNAPPPQIEPDDDDEGGISFPPPDPGDPDPPPATQITFANTLIAAANVGKLKLRNVLTDNAGDPFGVAGLLQIQRIDRDNAPSLMNVAVPGVAEQTLDYIVRLAGTTPPPSS